MTKDRLAALKAVIRATVPETRDPSLIVFSSHSRPRARMTTLDRTMLPSTLRDRMASWRPSLPRYPHAQHFPTRTRGQSAARQPTGQATGSRAAKNNRREGSKAIIPWHCVGGWPLLGPRQAKRAPIVLLILLFRAANVCVSQASGACLFHLDGLRPGSNQPSRRVFFFLHLLPHLADPPALLCLSTKSTNPRLRNLRAFHLPQTVIKAHNLSLSFFSLSSFPLFIRTRKLLIYISFYF